MKLSPIGVNSLARKASPRLKVHQTCHFQRIGVGSKRYMRDDELSSGTTGLFVLIHALAWCVWPHLYDYISLVTPSTI
ncbi:hypothetical protein DL93DRAFT_2080144 [Clavulina sp. PMI_390]|nr:hypothetical protein DL93DRAFT_2080144 [Clavulina sp. PMI_390]